MGQDSKIFLITISNLETQKGSAIAFAFAFGFYKLADFTYLLPLIMVQINSCYEMISSIWIE